MLTDLSILQKSIGFTFKDVTILKQSLIHSSYVNENLDSEPVSNERMEFLGDAMLGLIIAEKLYHQFPEYAEGELTRIRAALVGRDTLARLATAIKLGDYLFLGKGEEAGEGRRKKSNLASALEAVIAAIFIDSGFDLTRDFVLRLFHEEIKGLSDSNLLVDYKSRFQELIQGRKQCSPIYHLIEAVGPEHDKVFTIEVTVGESVYGKGSGKSKKAAETEAAREALERMKDTFTP